MVREGEELMLNKTLCSIHKRREGGEQKKSNFVFTYGVIFTLHVY